MMQKVILSIVVIAFVAKVNSQMQLPEVHFDMNEYMAHQQQEQQRAHHQMRQMPMPQPAMAQQPEHHMRQMHPMQPQPYQMNEQMVGSSQDFDETLGTPFIGLKPLFPLFPLGIPGFKFSNANLGRVGSLSFANSILGSGNPLDAQEESQLGSENNGERGHKKHKHNHFESNLGAEAPQLAYGYHHLTAHQAEPIPMQPMHYQLAEMQPMGPPMPQAMEMPQQHIHNAEDGARHFDWFKGGDDYGYGGGYGDDYGSDYGHDKGHHKGHHKGLDKGHDKGHDKGYGGYSSYGGGYNKGYGGGYESQYGGYDKGYGGSYGSEKGYGGGYSPYGGGSYGGSYAGYRASESAPVPHTHIPVPAPSKIEVDEAQKVEAKHTNQATSTPHPHSKPPCSNKSDKKCEEKTEEKPKKKSHNEATEKHVKHETTTASTTSTTTSTIAPKANRRRRSAVNPSPANSKRCLSKLFGEPFLFPPLLGIKNPLADEADSSVGASNPEAAQDEPAVAEPEPEVAAPEPEVAEPEPEVAAEEPEVGAALVVQPPGTEDEEEEETAESASKCKSADGKLKASKDSNGARSDTILRLAQPYAGVLNEKQWDRSGFVGRFMGPIEDIYFEFMPNEDMLKKLNLAGSGN